MMAFDTPIHTNEHSIERVLATGLPVALVFWRKGAVASEQFDQTLGNLARDLSGTLIFAKVESEDQPALVERYKVKELPTVVLITGGHEAGRVTGAAEQPALRRWLEATIRGERPAAPSGPSTGLSGGPTDRHQTADQTNQRAAGDAAVHPVILTDATFDRIVGQSQQPVLVDFWAPWCGPCRMLAPTIEQLAQEFAGKAIVAKLNVDENQQTAQRFGIRGIPAVYLFRGPQVVEQVVGVQPATVFRQLLTKHTR